MLTVISLLIAKQKKIVVTITSLNVNFQLLFSHIFHLLNVRKRGKIFNLNAKVFMLSFSYLHL
jgi:hypothetical protein